MKMSIPTKLFISHFVAIVLVSGSVGTYFYNSAIDNLIESLKSRLQNSAALVSSGFRETNLDTIQTENDTNHPVYQQSVRSLREFVSANQDIAFIYIMRQHGNEVVFVIDSDTDEPAMPGEVYPDVVPELLEGFVRPSVDSDITTDRWGSFLSGYSPLEAGDENYLIGIDMYANEVESKLQTIRLTGLLSLVLSILLAVIFSRLLSKNMTSRINLLVEKLGTIFPDTKQSTTHPDGDELDLLTDSFEKMSVRLKNNRTTLEENSIALKKAKEELENRVKMRTVELVETNQKLLFEIAERKNIEQRLEKLSHTDYLTGILNRRAMTIQLEKVSSRVKDESGCYSVILTDLDHFKQINDRYGHDVGDQALKHAVNYFKEGIRELDSLARWGGEEFLVMLPNSSLEEAQTTAERLCKLLSESRLSTLKGQLTITASFGVSRYQVGENLDHCLQRADNALYEAKSAGRNCVIVAAETA